MVEKKTKKGGQAFVNTLQPLRIQATVYTVQAYLSVSLFASVHFIQHIVSSLKLPATKLFFCSVCLHVWECNDTRTCQPIFNTMHRFCNSNTEAFWVLNLHQSIGAVDIIARQGKSPNI